MNQSWSLSVTTALLVFLYVTSLVCTQREFAAVSLFYVIPTQQYLRTCPKEDTPCMTLVDFAAKPANYFSNRNILVFLPGNHNLDQTLFLSGLHQFEMIGNATSIHATAISCSKGVGFHFEDINYIGVSGFIMFGCGPNNFFSLKTFILVDSIVNGRNFSNTGLVIKDVANATLLASSFYFNGGSGKNIKALDFTTGAITIVSSNALIKNCSFDGNVANESNFDSLTRGGAIFAVYSAVVATNSIFSNNLASYGGALFALNTEIAIYNCFFMRNTAYIFNGGAICAILSSKVTLTESTFSYNKAASFGGVMVAGKFTSVTIQSSQFYNNSAGEFGGVLAARKFCYVRINDTIFESNKAMVSSGVINIHNNSVIVIQSSQFQHNTAKHQGGVIGAFIESDVTLKGVTFTNNSVEQGSGGMMIAYGISSISIHNCCFEGNSAVEGGAIAVVYSNIEIINSEFKHNTASDQGGALEAQQKCNIALHNCTFSANWADRGGALYFERSYIASSNIVMTYNTAKTHGAAMHCKSALEGFDKYHISLENTVIAHNQAVSMNIDAGDVLLVNACNFISKGYLSLHNNTGSRGVIFMLNSNATFHKDTNFSNNLGSINAFDSMLRFEGNTVFANNSPHTNNSANKYQEGGAVSLFQSKLALFGNTTMLNNHAENGGAIKATQGNIVIGGNLVISSNLATLSGGAIYAYQSLLHVSGQTNFSNNTALIDGGGIYVSGSTLKFSKGPHLLKGNSALNNGGGMLLELGSKVLLVKFSKEKYNCTLDYDYSESCLQQADWIRVEFEDNSAKYGGAVYVEDIENAGVCSGKYTDPYLERNECFLGIEPLYQSEYKNLLTSHLNLRNIVFKNNVASVKGSNLYGGLLDRCSISPYVESYDNASESKKPIEYLQLTTNININSISSKPVRVCFCHQGRPNCSYTPPTIETMKGQAITIPAVAVDHVNHTLPSTIHSSTSSQGGGLSEGELRQPVTGNCTDLKFTVLSPYENEQLMLYAEGPCKDSGISKRSVKVKFRPCPIGFALTSSKVRCDCDPAIKLYITNCSISTSTLFRRGEFWIQNIANGSGYLVYPHCPFDYCYPPTQTVAINLNTRDGVDSQCSFNRSGKLCGKCKHGQSLSLGSTHCRQCSNYWLLLLVLFALAGVVLVAFLLTLNLTVAIGTINGLVFYANIIAANRSILFPFESPNILTVFVAWINLDFGFETCLFDGLDAYVKTWLQFVFPLYVIFLVVAIIVISDYSVRFAKLFTRKNPEATLATLILLSYTKLLRALIAALSFAQLQYPDGSHEIVWLLDANVDYLHGKHVPLFIAAVTTAIIGLAYTSILFLWQWLVKFSEKTFLLKWTKNAKLNSFPDAYHAPFNGIHRYWIGMLLIIRTLVYLVSAVNVFGDERVNLLAIVCAIIFLFLFQKFLNKRLYRKWQLDMLECSFIVNLAIFATVSFYCRDSQRKQTALACASIGIALLTFIAIIVYHICTFTFKRSKLLGSLREWLKKSIFAKHSEDECTSELNNLVADDRFNDKDVLRDAASVTIVDLPLCHGDASRTCTCDCVSDSTNTLETLEVPSLQQTEHMHTV